MDVFATLPSLKYLTARSTTAAAQGDEQKATRCETWKQLAAVAPRELVQGRPVSDIDLGFWNAEGDAPEAGSTRPDVQQDSAKAERTLWKKLGGGPLDSKGRQEFVLEALKERDVYSLTQAAKRRQAELQHSEVGPKRNLDPQRLSSLDPTLLRLVLSEDTPTASTEDEYATKRRELFRASMPGAGHGMFYFQDLVCKNPGAFSEDVAAEIEECYRSAAQRAREELDRVTKSPHHASSIEAFHQSVEDLKLERPFFAAPIRPKKSYLPSEEAARRRAARSWDVENSIFFHRKRENDSRGVYDSEKALLKQFELDWERIVSKSRFHRLVGREDAGVRMNDQGLHQELDEIKAELREKWKILRMAFVYYSMRNGPASSGNAFQLSLSQWMAFAQECRILDARSVGVKSTDLVRMFVSTNFEEDSKTEEAEANDDDALVRFEFLEILVRASFGKYISSKQLSDSSDSVKRLLEEDIIPSLPPEAALDPNTFRREKLYTAEMERVLKRNFEFLLATFKLYKAKDKTKYFSLEHWMAFLESVSLLGSHTGIEKREAKLVFAWSQMAVIDELKKRHRAISWKFFDFVEALVRLSEILHPPSNVQIQKALSPLPELPATVYAYYSALKDGECERVSDCHAGTLLEAFEQLLQYLVDALRLIWGGSTRDQLTERMKKMASRLSGGIELG